MFEVYTGTGEDKQFVSRFELRNDAILEAFKRRDKVGDHHGVRLDRKVIFSTNFKDPEFINTSGKAQ